MTNRQNLRGINYAKVVRVLLLLLLLGLLVVIGAPINVVKT
jgi:hypothetical protein